MDIFINGQTINLQEKTRRQLLTMITDLECEADNISGQLERAKRQEDEYGHVNKEWRSRATTALRLKRRQVEVIKRELSVRRNDRINGVAEHFIETAKEILNQDTFDFIMAEAKARFDLDVAGSLRPVTGIGD